MSTPNQSNQGESSTPRRMPSNAAESSTQAHTSLPPPAVHAASSASPSPPVSDSIPTPADGARAPSPVHSGLPRIPWQGAFPNFFTVGPNGHFIPHFAPPNLPPPQSTPALGAQIPSVGIAPPAHTTAPLPFPGFQGIPELGGMFHFFMGMPGNMAAQRADPEAAAELLRSLPTVDKGLFKRIERIARAEQEDEPDPEDRKGWTCGVCLEGVDLEEKETGVKALPCNHLFHASCLEPWFTSHYTCPTCRMDLDPMKTLRSNSRRGANRPNATGTGRTTQHPYNRPNPSGSAAETTAPQSEQPPPAPHHVPEFTFVWQMPVPAPPPDVDLPVTPLQDPPPPPEPSSADPNMGYNLLGGNLPGTPTQTFDVPIHASPLPMARSASAPSPSPAPAEPSTLSGDTERPQPQRRSHIHVIHHHHHHPHPVHPSSPHHHHHLRSPGQSSPTLPTAPSPGQTTSGTPAGGSGNETPGRFQVVINFTSDSAPPFVLPPLPSMQSARPTEGQHDADAAQRPSESTQTSRAPTEEPASRVVERQSLDSWVEARERALGWRCDAPECALAPADDEDLTMPKAQVKDMISIYSGLQPAQPEAVAQEGFEIHACPHRWHDTCLYMAERSAGRKYRPDEEGRVWVRCERCRADGWVQQTMSSSSENEVEAMFQQQLKTE